MNKLTYTFLLFLLLTSCDDNDNGLINEIVFRGIQYELVNGIVGTSAFHFPETSDPDSLYNIYAIELSNEVINKSNGGPIADQWTNGFGYPVNSSVVSYTKGPYLKLIMTVYVKKELDSESSPLDGEYHITDTDLAIEHRHDFFIQYTYVITDADGDGTREQIELETGSLNYYTQKDAIGSGQTIHDLSFAFREEGGLVYGSYSGILN